MMTPYHAADLVALYHGDTAETLRQLPCAAWGMRRTPRGSYWSSPSKSRRGIRVAIALWAIRWHRRHKPFKLLGKCASNGLAK